MLAEIHKSKKSYCYYTDPAKYSDFDLILQSKDDINPFSVDEAITRRAKRLGVPKESILKTDLVFRITCWDHIPLKPEKVKPISTKKAKKSVSAIVEEVAEDLIAPLECEVDEPVLNVNYVKLNFPPFEHYRFISYSELELVGRSHWKGDLQTGEFCRDHGKVTDKLAMMYLKLCERYATKANYRGYSFRDEMAAQGMIQLCIVGLQFDESKSDNPFAFYTACVTNAFNRVLNVEKKSRDIRDDLMQDAGYDPSYTRQNEVGDYGSDD